MIGAGAPPAPAAPASPAQGALLRACVDRAPQGLEPQLREAAVQLGACGRVYVHIAGAGASASPALLEWLARLYRLVADLAPRLDVVPLVAFAGWDAGKIDGLCHAGCFEPASSSGACCDHNANGNGDLSNSIREQTKAAVTTAAARVAHAIGATNPAAGAAAAAGAAVEGAGAAGTSPALRGADRSALQFEHVAVGGTFDRLHAGHRLLLAATALVAVERVYVGITADELLSKKAHREWLQSYDERCGGAVDFMRCVRPVLDVESGALRDPSAPTQAELDPGMQALVVSRETVAGGEAINRGRVARGFPQLRLVVVGVVGERPDGSKLSSSELRERDAVDSSRRSSGSSDGGGIAR